MFDRQSPSPEQWVTVSGMIQPDETVTLAPLFPALPPARPARVPEGAQETLAVDFLGRDGSLLRRGIVPIEEVCEHVRTGGPPARNFVGRLLRPVRTGGLRVLTNSGTELTTVWASPNAPEIDIDWTPPEEPVEGIATVAWRPGHLDGLPLSFMCLYSHHDDRWRSLGLPQESESVSIDFDELPGGPACRLAVVASDGMSFTVADTPPFPVPTKGVRGLIVGLEPAEPVRADELVVLRGQAFDMEREVRVDDMRWTSSRDGEIGRGPLIGARLSPGQHLIRLEAADATLSRAGEGAGALAVLDLQVVSASATGESDS